MFGVTNVSSRMSEAFLKPASRSPYDQDGIGVLAHRQTACLVLLSFCLGPFHVLGFGNSGRLALRWRRGSYPDVPFHTGIHRARQQRRDWINTERQRFPSNLDLLDGFGRRQFVDRCHRQNWLALIERLVGQRLFTSRISPDGHPRVVDLILRPRHFVGGRIAFTPGIASAALASMSLTRACE